MIYAPDVTVHMLSGKAVRVARAVRWHFLVDSVLNALITSKTFAIALPSFIPKAENRLQPYENKKKKQKS